MDRTKLKAAELASGLGAIVLGAGLALVRPDLLEGLAVPLLAIGVLVHGAGMTLKLRFERQEATVPRWELALFWLCWVSLVALGIWLAVRLLRG
jgi:hypothetical protein